MKIVINKCYGGFGLSKKAYEYLGLDWDDYKFYFSDEKRTDKKLVECVETLGAEASGMLSKLVVIEIPDDIEYEIADDDGIETVHEKHRSW